MAYNWQEIKAKWETGSYTMKQLSKEYGFNESYGYNKANENNWQKGKNEDKVKKAAQKRVLEDEIEKEAEIKRSIDGFLVELFNLLKEEVITKASQGGKPDFELLKSFKIASQTVQNIRKERYEVNEIQEIDKKIKNKLKEMKEERKKKENNAPELLEL